MKNKKPLQFVKELPPHAELWKIIDNTITHPGEGLSIKEIKHYMYVYLCISENFKSHKLMLQEEVDSKHLLFIKSMVIRKRTLLYPELLPESEELPHQLLLFIYEYYITSKALPESLFQNLTKIEKLFNLTTGPDLLDTEHSSDIVEIATKRGLEIAVYRAILDDSPIPTFKLVKPEEDSDDWIPWNGGECPVDPDTKVIIKLRDGRITQSETAGYWGWSHSGRDVDLIAYKIIKED